MSSLLQLEERVLALMEEFHRLKEENGDLSSQLVKLRRENRMLENDRDLNSVNKVRLTELESLNKKYTNERKAIWIKVQVALAKLEKFDPV